MTTIDEICKFEQAALTAQGLKRPRLAAVLFDRLGRVLEAAGQIQEAVVAYETGLRALAAQGGWI